MTLLPYDEALDRLLRAAPAPAVEIVPLSRAFGRILARPARADRDLPPFDRAALDGYAVRVGEPFGGERRLPVVAEIAAGGKPARPMRLGTCVRIMTGAPVPRGAEGIVPVERSEELEDGRVRLTGPLEPRGDARPGIADRGEDARRGAVVVARGTTLHPRHLAVLASIGLTDVPVFRHPALAVLATGGEIVPPAARPAAHEIRSSNDLLLTTLLRASGFEGVRDLGIVPDRMGILARRIGRALESCEVLVITGGVSAGRYDFVPGVLRDLGVRILFHKVAIRPGKPILVGVRGRGGERRTVFGLPGNPVSVLATSQLFLLPFLRMQRGEGRPPELRARLAEAIRRGGGLTHFVPASAWVDGDGILWARETPIRGSGDFSGASKACAFLRIEGDGEERPRGTTVPIVGIDPFDWSALAPQTGEES